MQSKPTPEQTCGRCLSFEPARHDPHYGYCKRHLAFERERSRTGCATARLIDVNTVCFIVSSPAGFQAFRPKEAA